MAAAITETIPLKVPAGRKEFDGFAAYFGERIAPYLRTREADRRKAVNKVFAIGGLTGVVAIAFYILGPFGTENLRIAAFIGFGGGALAMWVLKQARNDIGHGLLDLIAGKLGFAYVGAPARPAYCDRFRDLKLLPDFNREEWEDEVAGGYRGAHFTFCEAHLKYKTSGKNSSTRTVFHGQLFIIEYPKRFLGTTILLRDKGILNDLSKPGREFSRVGLASAIFEKAFEAWSTDQVEARDLLDPVVLERFQELERLCGGKKLRVAFDAGLVYLAIETGDRLNMGSMFTPLQGTERVEAILAEFDAVFDLIDVLLKRVDRPIDGAFSLAAVKGAAAS